MSEVITIILAVADRVVGPIGFGLLVALAMLLLLRKYVPPRWNIRLRSPFWTERNGDEKQGVTPAVQAEHASTDSAVVVGPKAAKRGALFPVGELRTEPWEVRGGFYVAVKNELPMGRVSAHVELAPKSSYLAPLLDRVVYEPAWEQSTKSIRFLKNGERQLITIASLDARTTPPRLVLWMLRPHSLGQKALFHCPTELTSADAKRIYITLRLYYFSRVYGERAFERFFSIGSDGIWAEERLLD